MGFGAKYWTPHMSLGTNAYAIGVQPKIFDYSSTIRILAGTHSDGAVIVSHFETQLVPSLPPSLSAPTPESVHHPIEVSDYQPKA